MALMAMVHTTDPATDIMERVRRDLDCIKIFNNQVLVALYMRPEKTQGGIIIPDKTRDEDKYQGKTGLVLKKGPAAFDPTAEGWFQDVTVDVGDWVFFRMSDAWGCKIGDVECRIVDDVHIRGSVDRPDRIY